ncbi:twitching motilty protein PilT [Candidatus Magnetobacterium bavaricum]|uniref:Twitching motilty protein PilT n=1 Tax=Candidatus Magnetobacterium bavaricum TaxID=29290 RepID=A0A0F3GU40_9BACT|nr:twitching motilty protein PilT [Candidatus Magnetobacterium bavaricum]
MNKYLLDTNILGYIEMRDAPNHKNIEKRLAGLNDEDEIYVSILAIYEMYYGASRCTPENRSKMLSMIESIKKRFIILPLQEEGAEVYGRLKTIYEEKIGISKKEITKHNIDFILAASAITAKAILVSNDALFENIQRIYPKLKLENWVKVIGSFAK